MYNYVVTAHKPSRVSHTAVGNFLGPDSRNLLVARVNNIQVYTITPEGLSSTLVLPIYGTISVMHLMRQPNETQDCLMLLTEKCKLTIMKWSPEEGRCHVVCSGDMTDHFVSNMASERIGAVDPNARCVVLHQCTRLLKVVPTAPTADKTAFNVRLLEDQVIDMVFLHGCSTPTVAILCAASKDAHQLRTYEISMSEQDISPSAWCKVDLDTTTSKIIAVPEPHCGVIVFGDESISYLSPNGDYITQPIDATLITAIGNVGKDGSRYLLGDHKGQLMMLLLERDESGKCERLKIENLGETSAACCISYLDSGFVFIGSNNGDSQLIQLHKLPMKDTSSYIEVVQTFPHLGPILDFCIVKGMGYLRQGQGQVVTCSGVSKDGSLRIIRNGIGISEHAAEELPGIKDMFSLSRNYGDRYHRYLLQSFTSETRVLELISAEEMAPATLPGFDEDSPTLFSANMEGDILVQVTATAVFVCNCSSMTPQDGPVWTPPAGVRISMASGNGRQLLLATTGGNLVLLSVDTEKKTLTETSHTKLGNEISCVNCNYLQMGSDMTDSDSPVQTGDAFLAAVGLWAEVKDSPIVELVALPSLRRIHTVQLGGDTIARGVLLVTLESYHYLLVALGDGFLLTYSLNAEAASEAASDDNAMNDGSKGLEIVSERRKLNVGTKPANLNTFKSRGADHVFAACDRPTVVYSGSGGGKLLVSNVNLQEVTRVCGFDTQAFPDCLAIATESGFQLGAVDEIQKLHITSIPLHEQPRRITHMDSSRVFAVLTEAAVMDESGDETLDQFVRLIDDSRYDTLSKYKLKRMESGASILSTTFIGENIDKDEQFLVVGTCIELPHEEDPKSGRILLFRIIEGKCVLVAEREVPGAVYSMCSLNGMLLASVGPEVRIMSMSERKDGMLVIKEEDRHHGHILGFRLALRGDFILVGDLLRSVTVLTCRKTGGKVRLEEVARDFDLTWVMAIELLDDDTYIVAEHSKHLYTYRRKSRAQTDAERGRLERVGQFHLGTRVNRIQHGSLVMQMPENESPALSTLIFGTIDGMLGVIARLKPDCYQFFLEVQNAMATLIPGVGGLKHSDWREMEQECPPRTAPARNFLDGDLIERFLDLSAAQMAKVSSMVNVGVEELVQRVEEMQRLHGAG